MHKQNFIQIKKSRSESLKYCLLSLLEIQIILFIFQLKSIEKNSFLSNDHVVQLIDKWNV